MDSVWINDFTESMQFYVLGTVTSRLVGKKIDDAIYSGTPLKGYL